MGEALVDVLPADDGLWRPVPGGSSYNVALALGRLGAPAAFVGRLSRDEQGRRMRSILEGAGVGVGLVTNDDRPSPLSLIERGSETGSARYSIHLAETAHAPPDLPADWLDGAAHLHVSSFSAITGAWGDAVGAALESARGATTRSLDVNIRPGLIPLQADACLLIDARLRHVEIVKASEDDLAWLFPGRAPADVAAEWSTKGLLAILTQGAAGATAFIGGASIPVPGQAIDVVDTVGAGDAFMAAFLTRAAESGLLSRLAHVEPCEIAPLLAFANAAAALCCRRAGADPPTRPEIEAFLERSRASRQSD